MNRKDGNIEKLGLVKEQESDGLIIKLWKMKVR